MNQVKKFTLVIHGGAGTILKSRSTPTEISEYRSALTEALNQGYSLLSKGAPAIEAVISAVKSMEDNPLFNAGKGSVFSNEGFNELDASIMDGKTLKAGSISGARTIKNPIVAANKVMNLSKHVMLMGEGADRFAKENGCEIVDQSYFFTQKRWDQLQRLKKEDLIALDHNSEALLEKNPTEKKFGTVGAVALDMHGDLAAGTSTGGLTNKKYGRVGDSPVIGAGTYANNKTCAVSCTGIGEFFLRTLGAYDVSAMMEYAGLGLEEASQKLIFKKFIEIGGEGGLVAVDREGNVAMPFSTEGMYRGVIREDGQAHVSIFRDSD